MGNLTTALVIVLAINVVLFLAQASMIGINPDASQFYKCEGTMLSTFDKQNCISGSNYDLNKGVGQDGLPSGSPTIETNTGNIFTDTFNAVRSWLLTSLGLQYLFDLLSAPYTFLQLFGLPAAFAFALSALWYGVTLFLLINWIKGGSA